MNDSANIDWVFFLYGGFWRARYIKRQERINFGTYYNGGTNAQWMLAIFTANIIAKCHEDAINWDSRELLRNSLNHFFTEDKSQVGAGWANVVFWSPSLKEILGKE